MTIQGMEGLTDEQVQQELARGAKFVIFYYTISILILTFKNPTNIYFIRAGEGTFGKSILYTVISLLFGWWGFPWGPIYTIAALVTNLSGGKDVTAEVVGTVGQT
jgi:hypothetical protein